MKRKIRTFKEIIEQGGLADVREVANYLRCSEPSIYAWARDGKIPSIKVSVLGIRFKPEDVIAWVEGQRLGEAQQGKQNSDETKQKMSQSHKRYWTERHLQIGRSWPFQRRPRAMVQQ